VSERFKVQSWKDCVGVSQPGVRISPTPPESIDNKDFEASDHESGANLVFDNSQPKLTQKIQSDAKLTHVLNGFLTVREAAKELGISHDTLIRWCKTGKVPASSKAYGGKTTFLISLPVLEMIQTQQKRTTQAAHLDPNKTHQDHKRFVKGWLKAMAVGVMSGRSFSPLTIDYYKSFVEDYLSKHNQMSIKGFRKELLSIPGESFAKRSKFYKALVCFAKYLIQEKALEEGFLEEVKNFLPKRHQPPKQPTVTEDDLEKLLAACKTTQARMTVMLLACTGLRASEACALLVEDLDLINGSLTVQVGKGGKRRVIGLNDALRDVLDLYLKESDKLGKAGHLLTNKDGEPQTRHGLGRRIEQIGQRVGIHVTPHALRRAFVTINANKGRPLQMLQRACGHSDIKTTMSYCRTSEQEVIDAMKGW
jgi:integrase/recombinase XerD